MDALYTVHAVIQSCTANDTRNRVIISLSCLDMSVCYYPITVRHWLYSCCCYTLVNVGRMYVVHIVETHQTMIENSCNC